MNFLDFDSVYRRIMAWSREAVSLKQSPSVFIARRAYEQGYHDGLEAQLTGHSNFPNPLASIPDPSED